eukprot:jgi/Orpsp1_1/1181271/evm.model.c7180000076561.1
MKDILKATNNQGQTVYSLCVEYNNKDILEYIINNYLNIDDSIDSIDRSRIIIKIIRLSIKNNKIDLIKYLLEQKIEFDNRDKYRKFPLFKTIRQNNESEELIEIVKLLLDYAEKENIDVNIIENGYTLLTLSYELNYKNIFKNLVVRNKVNKNQIDGNGKTILYYAIDKEDIETIENLIIYDADINLEDNEGNTPIFYAVEKKNLSIIKLLNENGVKIDIKNKDGKSLLDYTNDSKIREYLLHIGAYYDSNIALYYAIIEGNFKIVKDLLEKGKSLNLDEINIRGDSPLISVIKSGSFSQTEKESIINLMIQNGTNVDLNDKRGNSPITYAIKNNNVEVVNILIKNKANLDQMNQDKSTPLTIAINNNNINMVKLLIDSGADVNKLESIIFLACDKNKTEIFSYLIEHGANCNVKDNNGTPLLLLAIRNNINFDCIKKLVENNVNINERDNNGIDPLLEVIETNNTEIIKFLIDYSQKNNIKMNPINIELAISKLGYSILEYLLSSSSISIDSNQQREGKSLIIIIKSDKYSLEEKEKLIELLIEKGMNVDYINEEDGNTALYYATEKEYFSIIKLLVDKGANYL